MATGSVSPFTTRPQYIPPDAIIPLVQQLEQLLADEHAQHQRAIAAAKQTEHLLERSEQKVRDLDEENTALHTVVAELRRASLADMQASKAYAELLLHSQQAQERHASDAAASQQELRQLHAKLDDMQGQVANLKRQNETEHGEAAAEAAALRRQLDALGREAKEKDAELQQQRRTSHQQALERAGQLAESAREVQRLQTQVDAMTAASHSSQEELHSLTQRYADATQKLSVSQQQASQLAQVNDHLQQQLDQHKGIVQDLQGQLTAAAHHASSHAGTASGQMMWKSKMTKLRAELEAVRHERDQLKARLIN